MLHVKRFVLSALALSLALAFVAGRPAVAQERRVVNLYSARHYGAIEAPFNRFTEETGIEIRVSQGSPQSLLERLRAEGDRTVADVFLAIDAGVLDLAAQEGLLQPIESDILTANIAPEFRDPDNHWFGLSIRARTIVYHPERVDPSALSDYASLADPQFKDRLCMRPGAHIYTISLVSSLVHHLGQKEAEAVVAGWVANNPKYIDSDTRILEAIEAGECDVAIVNHYYVARKLNENPDFPVKLLWANQDSTGTFFNINGAGVVASALNREEAITFIEWMSQVENQSGTPEGFPGSNFEYPTNPAAAPNDIIASFGEVKFDTTYPLNAYGDTQSAAIELIERVGYGLSES